MLCKREDNVLCCSFCNKSQHEVQNIITSSNDCCICDECLELCFDILQETTGINLLERVAGDKESLYGIPLQSFLTRFNLSISSPLSALLIMLKSVLEELRNAKEEKAHAKRILEELERAREEFLQKKGCVDTILGQFMRREEKPTT